MALAVNSQVSLHDSALVSYLIWAALFLIGSFVLCLLPRVNCAYQMFCNNTLSYLLTELVFAVIRSMFFHDQPMTVPVELVIKAVCLILSVKLLFDQLELRGIRDVKLGAVRILDRIIASLINGITGTVVVCLAMDLVWELPFAVGILVFLAVAVASYFGDIFLFDALRRRVSHSRRRSPRSEREERQMEEEAAQAELEEQLERIDEDWEYIMAWEEEKWEQEREEREYEDARQRDDDWHRYHSNDSW